MQNFCFYHISQPTSAINIFLKKCSVFICFFIISGSISAQTSLLFTTSSLTDAQLSSSQLSIKQSYQSGLGVTSVNLINLASPSQIQQSRSINLRLPSDTILYTFTSSKLEAFSTGDFYWYGNLSNAPGYLGQTVLSDVFSGTLTIIGRNGRVFGEMRIDTNYFRIPSLGDNLNALVKYYDTSGSDSGCISQGGTITDTSEVVDERVQCPNVDVLILYTSAALSAYPDIVSRAYLAFNNTVQALDNSNVPKDRLNLNLKGVQLVSGFNVTGQWMQTDRPSIISANSNVQQLRDAYHADIVFILVPTVYQGFTGAVTGFGDKPSDGTSNAFAVVEVEYANMPTYTFAHELAHLFGGRHQWQKNCATNWDTSGLHDAHAYNWNKGFHLGLLHFDRQYKTVENACNYSFYTNVLNYSNPDVEVNGKKTGVAGENNNAKILRNAACRIANYKDSRDINVWTINGPVTITCPGYTFNITGSAFGGYGPYQLYWKYRLGSSGPWIDYNPNNSQSNFNFTVPSNFFGMIYIELTATNGTDFATCSTWAYSDYLNCPHYRPSAFDRETEVQASTSDFLIIPNPAKDKIQVQLSVPSKRDIDVVVTNLMGEICISKTIIYNGEDLSTFQLNLPNLPEGMYLVQLKQSGISSLVHKFVVTR